MARYNTTSYKNYLVENLNLKSNYNLELADIENLVSVYQQNGIIAISVTMDRDFYLTKQNKNDITNKEAIDDISELQNRIIEKITNDITDNLSNVASYEVLGEPISRVSSKTVDEILNENINTSNETTTTFSEKGVSVKKYTVIALVLGVVIYCGFVFLITLLDRTLKNSSDIKRYIDYPVLGYVNSDEAYKLLAITLSNITSSKVFNITSPISDSKEFSDKLANSLNN